MYITKNTIFWSLAGILLALPSAYAQKNGPVRPAGDKAPSVRINYFGNTQTIQVNLSHFEAVKKSSATLEATEIIPTYRCGGAYLLAAPKGLTAAELSSLSAAFKKTAEVEIAENATTVLVSYPPGNDELTRKVVDLRAGRALAPGDSRVKLKKGYLLRAPLPEGGYVEAVSERETIPSGDWFKTLMVRNRLKIDGRDVEGFSFGKLFGGTAFVYDMAERGDMDDGDINIFWFKSQASDMSFKETLAVLRDAKADICPVDLYNIPVRRPGGEEPAGEKNGAPEFICSNIKVSSSAAAGLWKRYAVREVNGVRIGFFYIVDNKIMQDILGPAQAELTDPLKTAEEMVKTLVESEKVDTVVMLTAFLPEDLQAILPKMPVVDIVINGTRDNYFTVMRNERVDLENWGEERVSPALVTALGQGRVGKLRLDYAAADGKERLAAVTQGSAGPPSAGRKRNKYDDREETGFLMNISSGAVVLPDPAKLLSDDRQSYAPLEIFNLAAAVVNERTTTEATLLKLHPFSMSIAGPVSEGVLRRWLSHKKIFTADIGGGALRQLLKQVDFDLASADSFDPWEKYSKDDWLAAAGVAKDGRLSGMVINGNETYRVSVTEDLLSAADKFPALAGLKNRTDTGLYLDDVAAAGLLRGARAGGVVENGTGTKPGAAVLYNGLLRRLITGTPQPRWRWRLNLKEVALRYSETQVSNTQAFAQVPNPKLQALDQTFLEGSLDMALEARRNAFWDDTKVSLDYGKIIIRPVGQDKVASETADRMLFENELRYAAFKWDKLGGAVLGPLVSLGYNTEFTAEAGTPKKRIAVGKAGVKVFEGRVIKDFYTAAVMERDFTYPDVYTKWAWETGTHLGGLLGGAGPEYSVDISYKQFSPNRLRATDLKMEFELAAKLRIKVFSDLSLAPFADYYAAKGVVSGKVAHNYMFGVSLDYSRLFKIRN